MISVLIITLLKAIGFLICHYLSLIWVLFFSIHYGRNHGLGLFFMFGFLLCCNISYVPPSCEHVISQIIPQHYTHFHLFQFFLLHLVLWVRLNVSIHSKCAFCLSRTRLVKLRTVILRLVGKLGHLDPHCLPTTQTSNARFTPIKLGDYKSTLLIKIHSLFKCPGSVEQKTELMVKYLKNLVHLA